MKGRVLIIAGSDSGGGAGIQADLKTVTMLGGFAATALTALTAQNTLGVTAVHEVPESFILEQIRVVLEDIGADCIKTGMLHSRPVIETVAMALDQYGRDIPVVVDPVMVAKGGHPLLLPEAMDCFRETMLPRATILTPNMPEAAALTGLTVESVDDMERAGHALIDAGARAVLVKGGHGSGEVLTDILVTAMDGNGVKFEHFHSDRIHSRNTHGTGCTLASAIAAGLAADLSVYDAVDRARDYVLDAIRSAPDLGAGHGPLNHGVWLPA